MNSENIVAVAVVLVVCVLVGIIARAIVSRERLRVNRWQRLLDLSCRQMSLADAGQAIIDFAASIVPAPAWALYRYDKQRKVFELLAYRGSADKSTNDHLAVQHTSYDTEDPGEFPVVLTDRSDMRSVCVSKERGTSILNVTLESSGQILGLVQGFPIASGEVSDRMIDAFEDSRGALGLVLSTAFQQEGSKSQLVDIQSLTRARDNILQGAFNPHRLAERVLGALVEAAAADGGMIHLTATEESLAATSVICAGNAQSAWVDDRERWQGILEVLDRQKLISRIGSTDPTIGNLPVNYVLGMPIVAHEDRVGTVVLTRGGEVPFGDAQIRLIQPITDQIGRILETDLAYQAAGNTYRNTLGTMADVIDARMPETVGHSLRVARWSVMIGTAMGLTKEELVTLHWGALLHDVGMCIIADDVLQTPGRLTDSETTRIRQHPQLGALFCDPIQTPGAIAPIVRSHHERWDGRGYPDGLAGDAIPLSARIVSVVEVFNAMVSARNYRAPRSYQSAVEVIQQESGRSFDPRVVDAFVQAVKMEMAKFDGKISETLPTGARCYEQKGTPVAVCKQCPAFRSEKACWLNPGMICEYHGDRRCETCFVYTQAVWRAQTQGLSMAGLEIAPRKSSEDANAQA